MRLIVTTDTVGGVWRFAHELTCELLEMGCSIAMVSFGRQPSEMQKAESYALCERWGERFRFVGSDVPLEWMGENTYSFDQGMAVLEPLAGSFGAELLHSSQFCFGASKLGIPTVITAHSDVFSWARACRGTSLEESAWLGHYRALVQQGLSGAGALAAPTEWMLQALRQEFCLPLKQKVIANGRAVSRRHRRDSKLQAVTVGRIWDEAKDIAILKEVQSPMPLVVAGDIEWDGIGSRTFSGISYRGVLNEEGILDLFAESAVYVCTSCYEPFGLAPLEAALCGCAVLARRIDSLREVWCDAALYFTDAEELSRLLLQLYENPTMRIEMQGKARRHAERFSRPRMAQEYLALFRSMRGKTTEEERVA